MTSVIDLTAEHANGTYISRLCPRKLTCYTADPSMSVTHDDDKELLRAIEESRVTAGLAPQESGITGTEKVAFGPATRSQYEENEWAMVTVGKSSAKEILLDPDPLGRKRDLNVPAFLKPSVGNHRLGALLTIYHGIPLLREVLLNRLDVLQNYGYDPEWWSGKAIELPVILGLEPDEGQELTYEIQRLMAFLDKTDRSYGSAEVLADLNIIKKMRRRGNRDLESAMFSAWKRIFDYRETGQVSKLFSIGVDSELRADSDEFAILDLPQPAKGSGLETFYDIADQALWPHSETDIANCAYLEHVADVITFRLNDENGPSDNVDVPAVWYPDRYLKSGRQAALDMRTQKSTVNEELQEAIRLEETLTEVCYRGKALKVTSMFRAALQHDQESLQEEKDAYSDQILMREDESMAQISSEKTQKLSDDLSKLVASIDRKLQGVFCAFDSLFFCGLIYCIDLNFQKEKARDTLRQLSKLYTKPSSEPHEPPTHKYTLRGVSTTNSTMYILRREETDLIDMGLENDGLHSNGDQWWRIEYSSSGSNFMTVEVGSFPDEHCETALADGFVRELQKKTSSRLQRRRARISF